MNGSGRCRNRACCVSCLIRILARVLDCRVNAPDCVDSSRGILLCFGLRACSCCFGGPGIEHRARAYLERAVFEKTSSTRHAGHPSRDIASGPCRFRCSMRRSPRCSPSTIFFNFLTSCASEAPSSARPRSIYVVLTSGLGL